MRWAGPAEEMESTCEEQAPEGTGEKQAPEGAGEEQALGLGSKPSPHNLSSNPGVPGGARIARNWTKPVGKKVSWTGFWLGIGDLPDIGSPSLPNSGRKCLGAPRVDGMRSRVGTGS